jgi:hypothetical protein
VSKINYTPQLSIWSPPVSLCPPDIHGGAETSCGNCCHLFCLLCLCQHDFRKPGFPGAEVNAHKHSRTRSTSPSRYPARHATCSIGTRTLETRSCNAADPTRPGGGTGIAAGERNEQRNPIPIPEEALRGTKNEANKTRSQFRVQSTEHAHTESDPVYR